MDISEAVSQGYKSLALRTIRLIEEFKSYFGDFGGFTEWRASLARVGTTGNVHPIPREGIIGLNDALPSIDGKINASGKPSTALECRDASVRAVVAYKGYPDNRSFLQDTGVDQFITSEEYGGITRRGNETYFVFLYDRRMPSWSVQKNIRNLLKTVSMEYKRCRGILDEFVGSEEGMRFSDAVLEDEMKVKVVHAMIQYYSILHYVALPESMDYAAEIGSNTAWLGDFLDTNLHIVDNLQCCTQGQIFLETDKALAHNPYARDPQILTAYRLMANMDSMLAALGPSFPLYAEVGIGLTELGGYGEILSDTSFRELTDKYFRPGAINLARRVQESA